MSDSLYIAWKYLVFNKVRSAILVACITLIAVLPLALEIIVKAGSLFPGPLDRDLEPVDIGQLASRDGRADASYDGRRQGRHVPVRE